MSITSTSTLAEVLAQYNDNLSWEGNPTKAALALEAVRWLLVNRPAELSQNNRNTKYSTLQEMERQLSAFVAASSASIMSRKCVFTRGFMKL